MPLLKQRYSCLDWLSNGVSISEAHNPWNTQISLSLLRRCFLVFEPRENWAYHSPGKLRYLGQQGSDQLDSELQLPYCDLGEAFAKTLRDCGGHVSPRNGQAGLPV